MDEGTRGGQRACVLNRKWAREWVYRLHTAEPGRAERWRIADLPRAVGVEVIPSYARGHEAEMLEYAGRPYIALARGLIDTPLGGACVARVVAEWLYKRAWALEPCCPERDSSYWGVAARLAIPAVMGRDLLAGRVAPCGIAEWVGVPAELVYLRMAQGATADAEMLAGKTRPVWDHAFDIWLEFLAQAEAGLPEGTLARPMARAVA